MSAAEAAEGVALSLRINRFITIANSLGYTVDIDRLNDKPFHQIKVLKGGEIVREGSYNTMPELYDWIRNDTFGQLDVAS